MTKLICKKHKLPVNGIKCPENPKCKDFVVVEDDEGGK